MGRVAAVTQQQCTLHPFIVCQFREPRWQVRVVGHRPFEIIDELPGQFGKQRRAAAIIGVEGLNQRLPALCSKAGAYDREASSQQELDITEKQLSVHRQAPGLDTGWRLMVLWVAYMPGHLHQLIME
ncbi:hypothetical protein D3C76_1105380 [compost metagenome]